MEILPIQVHHHYDLGFVCGRWRQRLHSFVVVGVIAHKRRGGKPLQAWPYIPTDPAPVIADDFPLHARKIVRDQGSQPAARGVRLGRPAVRTAIPMPLATGGVRVVTPPATWSVRAR